MLLKRNIHNFRGFDCGQTMVSFEDFAKRLKNHMRGKYRIENYSAFSNNCRDFCADVIFDILQPSLKNNGKLLMSNRFILNCLLAREYLMGLKMRQAWQGSLVELGKSFGSSSTLSSMDSMNSMNSFNSLNSMSSLNSFKGSF